MLKNRMSMALFIRKQNPNILYIRQKKIIGDMKESINIECNIIDVEPCSIPIKNLKDLKRDYRLSMQSKPFYKKLKTFMKNDFINISEKEGILTLKNWKCTNSECNIPNYNRCNILYKAVFPSNITNFSFSVIIDPSLLKILKKYTKIGDSITMYMKDNSIIAVSTKLGSIGNLSIFIGPLDSENNSFPSLFDLCYKKLFENSCPHQIYKILKELFTHIPTSVFYCKYNKYRHIISSLQNNETSIIKKNNLKN